jgi:hypothetical protein
LWDSRLVEICVQRHVFQVAEGLVEEALFANLVALVQIMFVPKTPEHLFLSLAPPNLIKGARA